MQPVKLNGTDVWGYVVESDEGMRVRFGIDDWQQLQIGEGQLIAVRIAGKNAGLFVTKVVTDPPVIWVTLARRVRAAG